MAEVRLSSGDLVLVDEEDIALVSQFRWSPHRRNGRVRYAQGWSPSLGRTITMHRLLLDAPAGMDVDHINGNGLDNRRSNLRLATRLENRRNQRKVARGCTSTYLGVCREAGKSRWQACVYVQGHRHRVGWFDSEEEAARAYDAKARELFGEFARLNFPEPHDQAA